MKRELGPLDFNQKVFVLNKNVDLKREKRYNRKRNTNKTCEIGTKYEKTPTHGRDRKISES